MPRQKETPGAALPAKSLEESKKGRGRGKTASKTVKVSALKDTSKGLTNGDTAAAVHGRGKQGGLKTVKDVEDDEIMNATKPSTSKGLTNGDAAAAVHGRGKQGGSKTVKAVKDDEILNASKPSTSKGLTNGDTAAAVKRRKASNTIKKNQETNLIDKFTIDERITIVKTYYKNQHSVETTATLCNFDNKAPPSADDILSLVNMFENTGSLVTGTETDSISVAGPSKPRSRKRKIEVVNEDGPQAPQQPPKQQVNEDQLDGSKASKVKKIDLKEDSDPAVGTYNIKISSWNVAGLRSWLQKDGLNFLNYENPDIFCLQETKCTTDQLPEEAARIPGYHPYWLCMPGGYAGVALYSKIMPINVEFGIKQPEFDDVGRAITAEYEKFFLVNVYVPNSGRKLVNLDKRMIWEEKFKAYIQSLDKLKPVIICGDMNVAHCEIDLANPKSNVKNAGFTKEEREKMTELLDCGFIDTFRHLYPNMEGAYTFWSYMRNARAKNVGWRLDYFITSERFSTKIIDNCIRAQCMGSDHCPITLFVKI